ncbi:MAG TPA: PIG-L deacetylase family protein [Thermomicrobiales bacterium]|nr:PIG-L deacetylase family protein [Thermomicrobiales bacterium]
MRIVQPPAGPIMAIAAHPDDIESWCGGTLALAVQAGAETRLLLVTSGDKGSADPDADPVDVARRREAEATEAGRRLGLAEVAFLRYLDGEVEATHRLRGELVRWIRQWRPVTLFTHDPELPEPPYIFHRDHRVVGRAALDAVYPLARDPLAFPEQRDEDLLPHHVARVWLFASAQADSYVDIRGGFEQKLTARLAHTSQTSDPSVLPASWQERAARVGAPAGLPLAEVFTVLDVG